jgi:hypothetical protein
VFYDSTRLASVTISSSVTTIGDYAFSNCSNLTAVCIGNNVTSIGYQAFGDCASLASVTIPDSVTSIGDWAFTGCASLTNVTIGNGATNIGNAAFSWRASLTGVYFQGNAPNSDGIVIFGDNDATVYYLPGTTGWTDFSADTGVPALLWTPQVQASDGSFGVRTDQFGFNISWASGMVVVVEACTHLVNPDWSPVGTNTLTSGSSYFSDPQWTNYPARFYRLTTP